MATIGNFENIIFNEHLGDDKGDLPTFTGMNFVGDASRLATFNIENPPVDGGYILLTLWDEQSKTFSHNLELNGIEILAIIKSINFSAGKHKYTNWVIPFDSNILRQGSNTLQMLRNINFGDNFHLSSAIVNWKEEVQFSSRPRLNLLQRVFGS